MATANLITDTVSDQWEGSVYSMMMMDKGMSHVSGGMGRDNTRFHHATQNSMQFKIELFIQGFSI